MYTSRPITYDKTVDLFEYEWTIVENVKPWTRETRALRTCVRVCACVHARARVCVCVCVCVYYVQCPYMCEWQLVHMVPEVEKTYSSSTSSRPCWIGEPGHRVSSILFNLDMESCRWIAKNSCISIVTFTVYCFFFLFSNLAS